MRRTMTGLVVALALGAAPGTISGQTGAADPPLPPLEVSMVVMVPEAREGGADALVEVRLSRPAEEIVEVLVGSRDVTARMGEDFPPVQRMLAFLPGEIVKQISVAALDDTQDEPLEETLQVTIDNVDVRDAVTVVPLVTLTIVDDDELFTPEAATATEGEETRVTLRRVHPSDRAVTVDLVPRSVTAESGEDFEQGPVRVTVPPDAVAHDVTIATLEDDRVEATEAYEVVAQSPDDDVYFTTDVAEALIVDDDGRLGFRWRSEWHSINEYEGGKEEARYVQETPVLPLQREETDEGVVYTTRRVRLDAEYWTADDGVLETSPGEFRVSELHGLDRFGLPGAPGIELEYALGPSIPHCLEPAPGLMLPCEAWAFHMMEEWEIDEDWGHSQDPLNPGATVTVSGFEQVTEQDGPTVVLARKVKRFENPGTADWEEVTFEILRIPQSGGSGGN